MRKQKGEVDELMLVIIVVAFFLGWMFYGAYQIDLRIGDMLKAAGL